MTEKENDIVKRFGMFCNDKSPSNELLVKFIEVAGEYLNLQTIPDYASSNNLSYNGAKNCRNKIELFGVKFIVDNE